MTARSIVYSPDALTKPESKACMQSDWPLARTPTAGFGLEHTMTMCAAGSAAPARGKVPDRNAIPIAAGQCGPARMAAGGLTLGIVHVASTDVMQARLPRRHLKDPCRSHQPAKQR